jgi:hypothetical protein
MKRLLLLTTLCIFCLSLAEAQSSRKRKKGSVAYNTKAKEDQKFLEKQWWLGLKMGTNLTKASVLANYSPIVPTNYDLEKINKSYESFNKLGTQAALEISFYFKQFSLSLQPTYQNSKFVYTNRYLWSDEEDGTNTLELNYEQEQKMNYAVIPLLAKFDLTTTKLRPYVQAGGFVSFLINAEKSVGISGIDQASGGTNNFTNEPIIVGATDLFANNYWGLAGGAGLNYHQGNVKFNLDILYQYGLTNVTSPENRYSNGMLASVGDALDDMTLDNIVISIGCLFPLRFLGSGFKSIYK